MRLANNDNSYVKLTCDEAKRLHLALIMGHLRKSSILYLSPYGAQARLDGQDERVMVYDPQRGVAVHMGRTEAIERLAEYRRWGFDSDLSDQTRRVVDYGVDAAYETFR